MTTIQGIADFIGINSTAKRLVCVHAKVGHLAVGGEGFNVPSLQEVGRQALASLAFISRGEPSPTWTEQRWTTDIQGNTIRLRGRNRIFGNPAALTPAQLNNELIQACRNPSFNKEIWIVGANMTRRDSLAQGLANEPFANRLRQFLMHWDGLQTSCAPASVRLKYYCS